MTPNIHIPDCAISYGIYAGSIAFALTLPGIYTVSVTPQDVLVYLSIAGVAIRIAGDLLKLCRSRKNGKHTEDGN